MKKEYSFCYLKVWVMIILALILILLYWNILYQSKNQYEVHIFMLDASGLHFYFCCNHVHNSCLHKRLNNNKMENNPGNRGGEEGHEELPSRQGLFGLSSLANWASLSAPHSLLQFQTAIDYCIIEQTGWRQSRLKRSPQTATGQQWNPEKQSHSDHKRLVISGFLSFPATKQKVCSKY